jgi:tripartite-type tricarboxylate transporter receptor subunit TctC
MFRHMTGIQINHIPYRGGGPALNDVISGQVKFFFSNGSASLGFVQAGIVKAIAHTGVGRLGTLPDLPPVSDTVPGFEAFEWNGVFVPAGTPAAIVQKLNAGLNAMLNEPAVVDRLNKLNVEYKPGTPEDFRAFVAAELEKWGRVVRDANIKLG